MKRILYSTALFVSLSLTGCQGFLDETPPSALVGDEAFSNPTMVYLNSVAQLYTALGVHGGFEDDYQGNNGLLDPFAEFSSDLIICPGRQGDWVDGGDYQNLFFQQYTPSYKMARASWNKLFNFIAKANKAIDDLEAIYERSEGESDYLLDYIYEIRALRAFYYLKAVDYFARVPIITSSEMSVSSVKQSDRSEVFNFVKTELEEIIPHLPEAKCQSMDTEYYGRVTKYVGYMLLAKLAINSPIYNDDNWNDGEYIASETEKFPGLPIYDAKILKEGRFDYNLQGVFDKISEAGKQIMFKCPDGTERNAWETVIMCQEELNKAGYILNPVFADNFTNDGNENSPENIFIRPSDYSTYKLNDSFPAYTYAYEHGSTWGMAVYQAVGGPSGSLQAMYLFQYDPETDSSPDPRFRQPGDIGVVVHISGNPQRLRQLSGNRILFKTGQIGCHEHLSADRIYRSRHPDANAGTVAVSGNLPNHGDDIIHHTARPFLSQRGTLDFRQHHAIAGYFGHTDIGSPQINTKICFHSQNSSCSHYTRAPSW